MPALLLNADYRPLVIVPRPRAVRLVTTDRVDVVEEREGVLRSKTYEMFDPAVLRLRKQVNAPYRHTGPVSKHGVLRRDAYICAYCGHRATTVDHVIPKSAGGKDTWENLVAACEKCNGKKGAKHLDDLGWTLSKKPIAATGSFWILVRVRMNEIDPLWLPYLN